MIDPAGRGLQELILRPVTDEGLMARLDAVASGRPAIRGATAPCPRNRGHRAPESDPYLVLGVSPTATQAEITHAYRTRLRAHHPTPVTHRPRKA